MTAGEFRLASIRVNEGESLSVPVKGFVGFGKKIYWRLTGQVDKSDVKKGSLSGSTRLNGNLEATIKVDFADDSKKEGSEKIGIQVSTDKSFQDPTRQLNAKGQNPLFFRVADASSKKVDVVTGIQDTSGDVGPKAGDLTLGLLSTTNSSKYGAYYLDFKSDLTSFNLFGDSNENGQFTGKDKFLGKFRVTETKDVGGFRDGVSRTFEYRQSSGILSLKYGSQTFLEASGDSNLF